MSFRYVGFLAFVFAGFTILSRIAEGAFIKGEDVTVMNTMTFTHNQSIFGSFNVPVLNPDFFTVGIPRLLLWDYSFFGGNAQILGYLFHTISVAAGFGFFVIVIGMATQFFVRR